MQRLDKLLQLITIIIVLDALNECDNLNDIRLVIYLLSLHKGFTSIGLKFLVTSRPELPIQLGFEGIDGKYEAIVLEEMP